MKPQIDANAPKVCGMAHLKTNWKRDEIAACRFDEIERDNRHLLRAISEVVKEHSHGSPACNHSRSMPSLPANSAFSFPGGPARKNEIIRIEKENIKLLRRLQNAHPEYNTRSWEAAHDKTREYVQRICNYPPPKMKKRSTHPTASLTKLSSEDVEVPCGELVVDSDAVASESVTAPPDSLQYVLTEDRLIEGIPFFVEMATDGRALAVSAFSREAQDTLELLVNEESHIQLYQEIRGDYRLLADRLRILPEGRLVIAEAYPPQTDVQDLSAIPNASVLPEAAETGWPTEIPVHVESSKPPSSVGEVGNQH
jgi:hypothetical protein